MLKNCYTVVFLVLLVALITGCATTTPKDTPVAEATNVAKVKEAPTEVPPTELPPTDVPTEEPAPTKTPTLEPEPELSKDTWKQIFGGPGHNTLQDVILADDGGFFIVGSTNVNFDGEPSADIYLVKMDENGELVWEETIDGDGYPFPQSIQETADNGLLISGALSSEDTDGGDIFILELDQDRNEIWSGYFGGPLDEFGMALPLPDGGYMLGGVIVDPDDIVADPGAAGYGGAAGRSNIYLSQIGEDGETVWTQTFGGENNVLAGSAAQTPDGGYLILATISYFPESGDDLYLLKVDQDGNEVWSKIWDEASMYGRDLIATSDGNFLISAAYSLSDDPSDPKADFLFIKVDPDGNEIWSKIFGDPEMIDYGKRVVETSDGGFVCAGEWTRDLYGSGEDISLVKLSADGEVIWQNLVPMGAHNMLTNLLLHPDGGFVIGGSTFNRGAFDIFMIKTDAEGNIE